MHTREQEQQIGDLAFQLWEQQGFPHSSDMQLRAEAESRLGLARGPSIPAPKAPTHS